MGKDPKDIKKKKAAALAYDPAKDSAPRLVAKGSGYVAERIIDLAKEKGIDLYEDPALVEALSVVDLGRQIPEELYSVVAEVLAFIYALDGRVSKINRS